jgi:hypothetical protein
MSRTRAAKQHPMTGLLPLGWQQLIRSLPAAGVGLPPAAVEPGPVLDVLEGFGLVRVIAVDCELRAYRTDDGNFFATGDAHSKRDSRAAAVLFTEWAKLVMRQYSVKR